MNPIHAMDHPLAAVDDDLSIERWEEKNGAEPSPSPDTSEANDAELPGYMRVWTQSSPEFLKLMAELGA